MGKTILKIFDVQDIGEFFKRCTVFEREIILEFAERPGAICPRCGALNRSRHGANLTSFALPIYTPYGCQGAKLQANTARIASRPKRKFLWLPDRDRRF